MEKKSMKAIGVDVGGHGVKAGVISAGGSTVSHFQEIHYSLVRQNRAVRKRDVPAYPRVEAVFTAIEAILKEENSIDAIGLASTGFVDTTTGTILDDQAPDYVGTNWIDKLSERFGTSYRYYVENDAKAAAWGEYQTAGMKAERRAPSPHPFIHVIVGSGIGAGVVLNGQLLEGARYVAGEFGSLPYSVGGVLASEPEIIETFASASGLLELSGCTDLLELAKKDNEGDQKVQDALRVAARALGTGLAMLINILGPETLVLGGKVVEIVPQYPRMALDYARQFAEQQAFEGVSFIPSSLGNEAGIVGIAHLAMDMGRTK